MVASVHLFWNRGMTGGIRANVDLACMDASKDSYLSKLFPKTLFWPCHYLLELFKNIV
jgi:hypothetical protein